LIRVARCRAEGSSGVGRALGSYTVSRLRAGDSLHECHLDHHHHPHRRARPSCPSGRLQTRRHAAANPAYHHTWLSRHLPLVATRRVYLSLSPALITNTHRSYCTIHDLKVHFGCYLLTYRLIPPHRLGFSILWACRPYPCRNLPYLFPCPSFRPALPPCPCRSRRTSCCQLDPFC